MTGIEDFYLQQQVTDENLRIDEGYYPDDRGPYRYAIRLFDTQTGTLLVEINDVSLVGAPDFGVAGVVMLTLKHDSDTPVPVRIDTRAQTCAFHPMHEEPLAVLNSRLASFWKPPAPPLLVQTPPSREVPTRIVVIVILIAFAALALFAVGRGHLNNGSFWFTYGLGFAGMLITVLLFTLRHTFRGR